MYFEVKILRKLQSIFFRICSSGSKYITFPASLILLQNLVLHMNDYPLFIRIQKYNRKYAVIGISR